VPPPDRPAPGRGARLDLLDQPLDQGGVWRSADLAAEPPAGRAPHRHRHPEHGSLGLDADFITLHLPHLRWLLHAVLLDWWTVRAAVLEPTLDPALIEPEGHDHRWEGAAVRHESHHQPDHLDGFLQAVKARAFSRAASPATLTTAEASLWLGVHANVALVGLSSGRAVQVRATDIGWGQRRSVFLLCQKKDGRWASDFFKERLDHD